METDSRKVVLAEYAKRTLANLGITMADDEYNKLTEKNCIRNWVETKEYDYGTFKVNVEICDFDNTDCRVDININLPNDGIVALEYMHYCGKAEQIKKNNGHKYTIGHYYQNYMDELRKKITFAYCPWGGQSFYIRSERYKLSEIEEAVKYASELAMLFLKHESEYESMRVWSINDDEVKAKAREIIANADFRPTDYDREYRGYYIVDRNSFITGWFYPSWDDGKGSFDIGWRGMALSKWNEGTFERCVAEIVFHDATAISKARISCEY